MLLSSMKATGSNKTVLFRQIDQSPRKITHNPVGIAMCLSSVINDNDIQDVRVNRRQNVGSCGRIKISF